MSWKSAILGSLQVTGMLILLSIVLILIYVSFFASLLSTMGFGYFGLVFSLAFVILGIVSIIFIILRCQLLLKKHGWSSPNTAFWVALAFWINTHLLASIEGVGIFETVPPYIFYSLVKILLFLMSGIVLIFGTLLAFYFLYLPTKDQRFQNVLNILLVILIVIPLIPEYNMLKKLEYTAQITEDKKTDAYIQQAEAEQKIREASLGLDFPLYFSEPTSQYVMLTYAASSLDKQNNHMSEYISSNSFTINEYKNTNRIICTNYAPWSSEERIKMFTKPCEIVDEVKPGQPIYRGETNYSDNLNSYYLSSIFDNATLVILSGPNDNNSHPTQKEMIEYLKTFRKVTPEELETIIENNIKAVNE